MYTMYRQYNLLIVNGKNECTYEYMYNNVHEHQTKNNNNLRA